MLVYLAGPITGLRFDEAAEWRESFDLPEGWAGLSPLRGKEHLRSDVILASDFDGGSVAVARDLTDIEKCDVVLANFLGAESISAGTMAEIGFAYANYKPIIVVLEEGSVHDHVFVKHMATSIVPTLDDARRALGRWHGWHHGSAPLAA